jgi:predicted nucleotidyltransferase
MTIKTSHDLLDIEDYIINHLPSDCNTILHISEVGSFMWGMGNENDPTKGISDHDIFVIYQVSTKSILSGYRIKDNSPSKHDITINGKQFDFSFMEIGHFINLLIKGNINVIWGLTSPLIYKSNVNDIKEYVSKNINHFNILPSAIGMATSSLNDSVKRASVRPPQKCINTAYRTLIWTKQVYNEDVINYLVKCENVTEERCQNVIKEIKEVYVDGDHNIMELYLRNALYTIRYNDLSSTRERGSI